MRRFTTCRSCEADIWWAKTTTGRLMPVDADRNPEGLVHVVDRYADPPVVEVLKQTQIPVLVEHPDLRFDSHFVTCPNAAQHRKR